MDNSRQISPGIHGSLVAGFLSTNERQDLHHTNPLNDVEKNVEEYEYPPSTINDIILERLNDIESKLDILVNKNI